MMPAGHVTPAWEEDDMRECDRHILETLELCRQLTILADEGERDARDDSCVVLYGVVRDCAYKMRRQGEREREAHVAAGAWDGDAA